MSQEEMVKSGPPIDIQKVKLKRVGQCIEMDCPDPTHPDRLLSFRANVNRRMGMKDFRWKRKYGNYWCYPTKPAIFPVLEKILHDKFSNMSPEETMALGYDVNRNEVTQKSVFNRKYEKNQRRMVRKPVTSVPLHSYSFSGLVYKKAAKAAARKLVEHPDQLERFLERMIASSMENENDAAEKLSEFVIERLSR